MMAYGQLYDCPELALLYPHHAGLGRESLATNYLIHGSTDRLHVRTVEVSQCEVGIVADLATMFQGLGGRASARSQLKSADGGL